MRAEARNGGTPTFGNPPEILLESCSARADDVPPLTRPLDLSHKKDTSSGFYNFQLSIQSHPTGGPLGGALVRVVERGGTEHRKKTEEVFGIAQFHLNPGEHRLYVTKKGYLPGNLRVGMSEGTASLEKNLALPEAISAQGRVVNTEGAPIEGAVVRFRRQRPLKAAPMEGTRPTFTRGTNSRSDGRFNLELAPGIYRVSARKTPYAATILRGVKITSAPLPPIEIQVNQEGRTIRVSGLVTDPEGKLIPAARVTVSRSSSPRAKSALNRTAAGNEGRFELEVPALVQAYLIVQARGYEDHTRVISLKADQELTVVLKAPETFRVRVLSENGMPVDDAVVQGYSSRGQNVLGGLGRDQYYAMEYPFRISAQAFHRGLGRTGVQLIETHRPQIELLFEPGGEVAGRITSSDGSPVETFGLYLRPAEGFSMGSSLDTADGSFHLRSIPTGPCTLIVRAPGFAEQRQELLIQEGKTRFLEVVLRARDQANRKFFSVH